MLNWYVNQSIINLFEFSTCFKMIKKDKNVFVQEFLAL